MWLWVKSNGIPFWVGAPILVYFSGGWDFHWGYGLLTHGHVSAGLGNDRSAATRWGFVG